MKYPSSNQEVWLRKGTPVSSTNQQRLSKKARNRILNILDQYYGGSACDPNRERTKTSLVLENLAIECDVEDIAVINSSIATYLELLIKRGFGFKSVSFMDDLPIVVKRLSKIILDRNGFSTTIVNIGLGATSYLPSIRIPAYIIPVINSMVEMVELDIELPIVRVFKADHIGILVNDLDPEDTLASSAAALDFLSCFVERFYPDLISQFVFERDNDLKDSEVLNDILRLSAILPTIDKIEDEIESFRNMGFRHGNHSGSMNALVYAAAHPFYNQTLYPIKYLNTLTPRIGQKPYLIVDHGGKAQIKFNNCIKAMRETVSKEDYELIPAINLITSCKVPVYYMAKGGDFDIGCDTDSIDLQSVDPMTRSDYQTIFRNITEYEYKCFIRDFQEKYLYETIIQGTKS